MDQPVVPVWGYLVRCGGLLPDGGTCPHYVLLTAEEKTTCQVCRRVHACWTDYCLARTKTAADTITVYPFPASPSPAPSDSPSDGGGGSF